MSSNPFELVTASKLSAEEAVKLWCDDNRLNRVRGKESCFINGHRGTGKSMLFRILQHDCQRILNPDEIPNFLSIYCPVRDSEFMAEELEFFQSDAQKHIVSESHFCLLIFEILMSMLRKEPNLVPEGKQDMFLALAQNKIRSAYAYSIDSPPSFSCSSTAHERIAEMASFIENERVRVVNYICLRFYNQQEAYNGPLFLFDTLLAPIADFFADEVGQSLYILIDDGDDLPRSHTVVLNSWIARRRGSTVFKVSTMYGYKTYETKSKSAIQQSHDFLRYEITTRFMSNSSEDYIDLLKQICIKRLNQSQIAANERSLDPYEFFPEDANQKERLEQLRAELTEKYEELYEGRSIGDKVYRHLTSEYMKQLRKSRSTDTYSYAGFHTLALLSGGMVRDFIICALKMYDEAARETDQVVEIPPAIQNNTVRTHADLILQEIGDSREKREREGADWKKIRNMIEGLGNLFKNKMFSNDSERRVFSFALQQDPDSETQRLLELAVGEGYLMEGFISRKEGTGRRTLYVLTRRLAPLFNLDVSAYSGYLSLEPSILMKFANDGPDRQHLENAASSKQYDLFDNRSTESSDDSWIILDQDI